MDSGSGSTNRWECVDFELEIREGGPREYPVAARSPEGEAQEYMRFPFDEWQLKDKLRDVEVALLRSGGSRRALDTPEEQSVQEFGKALFEALIVGDVGSHYRVSLREAKRQNKGMRLKLHIRPPELSVLPWEFLYDPSRDYLCLSTTTPLVRYLNLPLPTGRLAVTPPLRILGMVASPQGLPQLDVGHEKRLMEEAIKAPRAEGLVELTWLKGETWRDLHRAMRRGPWHVFHFIGHGGFDPETEEGAIALSDEEGRKHLLGARRLARLLDDHHSLRLAFLNSCEGAKGSERDAFSSTAAALVRCGIPAVVAMQYEVTDVAAIEFSRNFYDAVAEGLPMDAAVAEARTGVNMVSALEWGTPVLYMRSPDGRVFDISTEASPGELTREEARDREEEQRQNRLDELYTQARRSHRDRQWQAVVDVFDQIHALVPDYPDPEGLLKPAQQALAALEREQTVTTLYHQGQQRVEVEEWEQALECFEEVHRLEPGYRDTERLLSRVRQELVKPPTVEVPDLIGQSASQASSTLENRGLKLGDQNEITSETVPKGEIIRQNPEAGTEVEAGCSVSVTLSSGPSTVEVPDLTGRRLPEVRSKLASASLKLGGKDEALSDTVAKGGVIKQDPAAGTKAKLGSSVTVAVSLGPQKVTAPEPSGQSTTEAKQAKSSPSDSRAWDKHSLHSQPKRDKQSSPPQAAPQRRSPTRHQDRERRSRGVPHWLMVAVPFAIVALLIVVVTAVSSGTWSLEGKTLSEAAQSLEGEGTYVTVEYVKASDQPKGIIIDQKYSGTLTFVTLSGGQGNVEVPDVSGLSSSQAAKTLIDAGLEPPCCLGFDHSGNPAVIKLDDKTIIATEPSAGKEVWSGTSVQMEATDGTIFDGTSERLSPPHM